MAKKQPRRKQAPQRSCVACRQKFDKRDITRIVCNTDDGVIVDVTGKRNGRGAYLCANPDCWEVAIQRKALNTALKTTLTKDEQTAILAQKPVARKEVAV